MRYNINHISSLNLDLKRHGFPAITAITEALYIPHRKGINLRAVTLYLQAADLVPMHNADMHPLKVKQLESLRKMLHI